MGDADDKTSALIAKLLSEDNAYADYSEQEYAMDDSDDSEYGDHGRKKRAKKGRCMGIGVLHIHKVLNRLHCISWNI